MPRLSAIALHSRLSSTLIPKDNTLFDYFVENHLAAHVLAGLDVSFRFPAGYSTTIVPQLRTLFGARPEREVLVQHWPSGILARWPWRISRSRLRLV